MHADRKRLLILPLMACLWGCAGVPVERRGAPQQQVVSDTYSVDLPALRQAILDNFAPSPHAAEVPFHDLRAIELKPPDYPSEWISGWVDTGSFLAPYRSIPALRRAQDLMLDEPTGDHYWLSEYHAAQGPVRFRCGFILHFEQPRPHLTEVQVFEKVPLVWPGEHWAMLHHGIGIGRVHDIRPVDPTVKDRLDLLQALHALASRMAPRAAASNLVNGVALKR